MTLQFKPIIINRDITEEFWIYPIKNITLHDYFCIMKDIGDVLDRSVVPYDICSEGFVILPKGQKINHDTRRKYKHCVFWGKQLIHGIYADDDWENKYFNNENVYIKGSNDIYYLPYIESHRKIYNEHLKISFRDASEGKNEKWTDDERWIIYHIFEKYNFLVVIPQTSLVPLSHPGNIILFNHPHTSSSASNCSSSPFDFWSYVKEKIGIDIIISERSDIIHEIKGMIRFDPNSVWNHIWEFEDLYCWLYEHIDTHRLFSDKNIPFLANVNHPISTWINEIGFNIHIDKNWINILILDILEKCYNPKIKFKDEKKIFVGSDTYSYFLKKGFYVIRKIKPKDYYSNHKGCYQGSWISVSIENFNKSLENRFIYEQLMRAYIPSPTDYCEYRGRRRDILLNRKWKTPLIFREKSENSITYDQDLINNDFKVLIGEYNAPGFRVDWQPDKGIIVNQKVLVEKMREFNIDPESYSVRWFRENAIAGIMWILDKCELEDFPYPVEPKFNMLDHILTKAIPPNKFVKPTFNTPPVEFTESQPITDWSKNLVVESSSNVSINNSIIPYKVISTKNDLENGFYFSPTTDFTLNDFVNLMKQIESVLDVDVVPFNKDCGGFVVLPKGMKMEYCSYTKHCTINFKNWPWVSDDWMEKWTNNEQILIHGVDMNDINRRIRYSSLSCDEPFPNETRVYFRGGRDNRQNPNKYDIWTNGEMQKVYQIFRNIFEYTRLRSSFLIPFYQPEYVGIIDNYSNFPICRESKREQQKVYLIREGNKDKYKIGKSKDPLKRRCGLQTGNSKDLTLIATADNKTEDEVHNYFASYRYKREFFKFTQQQINDIVLPYFNAGPSCSSSNPIPELDFRSWFEERTNVKIIITKRSNKILEIEGAICLDNIMWDCFCGRDNIYGVLDRNIDIENIFNDENIAFLSQQKHHIGNWIKFYNSEYIPKEDWLRYLIHIMLIECYYPNVKFENIRCVSVFAKDEHNKNFIEYSIFKKGKIYTLRQIKIDDYLKYRTPSSYTPFTPVPVESFNKSRDVKYMFDELMKAYIPNDEHRLQFKKRRQDILFERKWKSSLKISQKPSRYSRCSYNAIQYWELLELDYSFICFDYDGEDFPVTEVEYKEKLGKNVIIVDPDALVLKFNQFNIYFHDQNPIDWIEQNRIAELLWIFDPCIIDDFPL